MTVRILVVDDEPRYLRLLEANLLTEDYQVFTAMDGEEAIESFSANPVDLILLDVMLPRMDGFATCQGLSFQESVGTLTTGALYTGANEQPPRKIAPIAAATKLRLEIIICHSLPSRVANPSH